jgi:SWI/SNF-related matrix-associated actin-dependent regulator of chromatin subfamily A3
MWQPDEPPQFYGGIIADPMGLGKTLTMIALVAMDVEAEKDEDTDLDDMDRECRDVEATLVIIPPPRKHICSKSLSDANVQHSHWVVGATD